MAALAYRKREITSNAVDVTFVDQVDIGAQPAADAAAHGSRLEVVTLPTARRGVGVLLQRWMAGWVSAASLGRRASVAWCVTTNVWW